MYIFQSIIGEKPLKCNLCSSSFVNVSNLNKHQLFHTGFVIL